METPEILAARTPVLDHLEEVVARTREVTDGEPYAIGAEHPSATGVAICTVDGHEYAGGESEERFAIQSISTACTYALALIDRGSEYMDARINVEPSGEAFNEISLDGEPHRPANPLVNVGAIAADWCVLEPRFPRILEFYERLAGRPLEVDEEVYAAETEDAARNRALAWLLTSAGVVDGDPEDALDAYLRQCSVLVTAADLARMGATLANRGVHPVSGERIMPAAVAERVMSVMATCGMYDNAGEWMIRVGLPAKSGVGGGIVAAAPGQLGIGTFAPPLDRHGNSVRGTLVCEHLSQDFDLHFTRVSPPHHLTVRQVVDLSDRARLVELQGDLAFLGIEAAMRTILGAAVDREAVVVDMTRVGTVVSHARHLLPRVNEQLASTGHRLLVIGDETRLGDGTWCADVEDALARLRAD